jgi:putative redox protein
MDRVRLRKSGPRQFVGIDSKQHTLTVDIQPEFGGESAGLKPSDLMPLSLGSCIGVTAVGILEKMRQGPFELNVDIDFEHEPDPPKKFTQFNLTWHFKGEGLDKDKLLKAITTAEHKYCSVSASLKDEIVVKHTLTLLEVAVA